MGGVLIDHPETAVRLGQQVEVAVGAEVAQRGKRGAPGSRPNALGYRRGGQRWGQRVIGQRGFHAPPDRGGHLGLLEQSHPTLVGCGLDQDAVRRQFEVDDPGRVAAGGEQFPVAGQHRL